MGGTERMAVKEKKKASSVSKIVRWVVVVVCVALLIHGGYNLVQTLHNYRIADELYADAAEEFVNFDDLDVDEDEGDEGDDEEDDESGDVTDPEDDPPESTTKAASKKTSKSSSKTTSASENQSSQSTKKTSKKTTKNSTKNTSKNSTKATSKNTSGNDAGNTTKATTKKTTAKKSAKKSGRPASINFEKLQEINPDVIGWIYISGAKVNYPILKGRSNSTYLRRDYRKKKLTAGSIFVDYRNSGDFSDWNTIIYGHNMRNGSMFGKLKNLKTSKDKYVWIYTPNGTYQYQISAVFTTPVNSYVYHIYKKQTDEYEEWVEKINKNTLSGRSKVPTEGSRCLTLSTCSSNTSKRTVVIAYRVS